jgi:ubiquinone biosynthesis protein
MIPLSRTPTRLIDSGERHGVRLESASRPSRFRSLVVAGRLIALAARCGVLWMRRQISAQRLGIELRRLFEDMGGLWIKTGQLLALRIDLFPVALCEELAKLQYSAVGFPVDVARQIVEEELGAPIEDHFDQFGDHPFAVASIGQVFRAHLRQEDAWVAVKVQRPYIAEIFLRDFVVIRWIVRLLQVFRVYPHMRWDLGLRELRDVMEEEIDYCYESSNIRRMRKTLKAHKIFVPKVYLSYCSRRLLVTEFIHGILMADYIKVANSDPEKLTQWLAENDVNPKRVAKKLMNSIFRQVLEDNLFHGDLHPGNIVLLRGSRIALIDFGTVSFTEREYLDRFRMFVSALAARDYSKAADVSFMLTARLPHIDLEPVKEKVVQVLKSWTRRTLVRELPYHSKSLENVSISVVRIMVEHRCTMEWAFLRIHRAFTTLDMSLVYLNRHVNYSGMLQKYFRRAEVRSLEQMFTPRWNVRVLDAFRKGLDIQDRTNEYTMFQGQLVRRHAQLVEGATDKLGAFLGLLVTAVAAAVFAVGAGGTAVFLAQYYPSAVSVVGSDRLGRVAAAAPRLDYWLWVGLIVTAGFAFYRLLRTSRILRRHSTRHGQSVAAV